MSAIEFKINGETHSVEVNASTIELPLGVYIRNYAQLTGTKLMCREAGCGACTVMVKRINPISKDEEIRSMNSCITPVLACDGYEITTIEGLGNRKVGYHAIQTRMTHFGGSQCGFCSPGMIMSMYSLLKGQKEQITMEQVENAFSGNICRCTGYRSILDAMKSFSVDADEKLNNMVKDIEDLKLCKKSGKPCRGLCESKSRVIRNIPNDSNDTIKWIRVCHLAEIFKIMKKSNADKIMFVGGNTATGIYRRDSDIDLFIDISQVEELRSYAVDANEIRLGANTPITETIAIFKKISASYPQFEYLLKIANHLELIANVSVRNNGTLAGNLMIKYNHNEFESDIFVLFEAVGAKLVITDYQINTVTVTPVEFLKLNMSKRVLVKIIFPPHISGSYIFQTYTIRPISQNAISYVLSAFFLQLSDNNTIINGTKICYDGINNSFIHATATEAQLSSGQYSIDNICKNSNLLDLLQILSNEIYPVTSLIRASPEYRKGVAIALLYKFILSICKDSKIKKSYESGKTVLTRPLSSGTQTYDTVQKNYPITQPVAKIESVYQCSGEASYINDMPSIPNQLYAAFVVATKVGYTISEINPEKALSIPGVHYFFSAKDIPGRNSFTPYYFPLTQEDEEVLCSGKVLFHGHQCGIILADTFKLAHSAAELVEIEYVKTISSWHDDDDEVYPTLGDVMDIIDFCKIESRILEEPKYAYSGPPCDQNLINLGQNKTIKGRSLFHNQYHNHMETHNCISVPNDDGMDVYSGTQWMDFTQAAIAEMLNINSSTINMSIRRLGGGFGSKISRATLIACAASLACHHTNRPIRFEMSLEANMTIIGKRWGCLSDHRMDVTPKGKIVSLKNTYYQDYGCSLNEPVQFFTTPGFRNCYNNQGWDVKTYNVKTDAPKSTWLRGPGTLEGIAMIENIMEHIAYDLNLEAADVRLENFLDEFPIRKIYNDFMTSSNYRARKATIDEYNRNNRWRKRGIATSCMRFEMIYFLGFSAFVSIYHNDGTVAITHGGIEIGQGINTKAAQTAAYILNVPLESVSVKAANNMTAANSFLTGASVTSDSVCYTVKRACEILLDRLKPVQAANPDKKWFEITRAAYNEGVDLTASYFFKPTDLSGYNVWGVSCAEVEVDILTGKYQILRVDLLEDVGESLSPIVDVGQVEGAFMMGMGYWLQEQLIFNRQTGELLTNRTWNYKPPGAKDIPIDFRISFLQNSNSNEGFLRAKSTGEPGICLAFVCVFALRHAINSARTDAGFKKEWYEIEYPLTPEKVFRLCGNDFKSYKIN